jgi:hypothetical protein
MGLLALMIAVGLVVLLMVAARCTLFAVVDPACTEKNWGAQIKDWMSETLPILVAIIMRGNRAATRPPPPSPPDQIRNDE